MNLRNLPARLGTSLVAVIGIGGVVAVLVSLLSMGEGFRAALDLSGRDDVALILRGGSSDELSSAFGRDEVNVIVSAPGIAHDARGADRVAGVLHDRGPADAQHRHRGQRAVPRRDARARREVREGFRIVAGRMFEPGKDEVIVGRGAFAQFGNVDLGREVTWGSHVVAGGRRVRGGRQRLGVRGLDRPHRAAGRLPARQLRADRARAGSRHRPRIGTLERWLDADPRINASVRSEREFYADQSRILIALIRYVGTTIAVLMGIGAVFAALNTMYSAVSSRTREIATLRALGFGAAPVVASVLLEAVRARAARRCRWAARSCTSG